MTSLIGEYLDRVNALDMLDLYTQEFTLTFGSLRDVVDETATSRRVEHFHGRTALAWIVAGPVFMLQSGYQMAFESCRDMNGDTRSNLMKFIRVMQDYLTADSLRDAKDLELFF